MAQITPMAFLHTLHWKFHIFKRVRSFRRSSRSTFVQFFLTSIPLPASHATRRKLVAKVPSLIRFNLGTNWIAFRFCTLGEFSRIQIPCKFITIIIRLKIERFYRKNNAGTESHRVHHRNTCAKTFVILSM